MDKSELKSVPNEPGCYLWKDINNQVIYVGKSKNLKSRMLQYFNDNQNYKNSLLVKNIASFDYIVTRSDKESFLLETELIHKYEPKYNIKVKHNGYSPYIVLSDGEEKILKVERSLTKKYKYVYGPFPVEFGPFTIIKILNEIFPFNKCQQKGSGKPCIYYQMNMCLGHCIKKVTEEDYKFYIDKLNDFFRGNVDYVQDRLISKIESYSTKLNFEEAQKLSKMLNVVKKYSETQKTYFKNQLSADIFGWWRYNNYFSISISMIRFGKFIRTDNYINKIFDFQNEEEVAENFISLYYNQNRKPKELILPKSLNNLNEEFNIINLPKKGLKKEFLDLTIKDAVKRIEQEFISLEQREKRYKSFLNFLETNLKISQAQEIEMLDISSINGESQVGAVVAFSNGQKNSNMYRKYIISSIDTQDDYGSIREVVYRHFRQKLMKKINFPDVFIVDGGKGQLNAVLQVVKELNIDVKIFALKKNSSHKTESVLFVDNEEIIQMPISKLENGVAEIFIQMQEEVHRFVIEFNTKKRSEKLFENSLSKATFLTKKDLEKLYSFYDTIHQMKNTNPIDIEKIIGKSKTEKLFHFFVNLK